MPEPRNIYEFLTSLISRNKYDSPKAYFLEWLKANISQYTTYKNITEEDIWSYLSEVKWTKSKGLMLSDIVNDILKTNNEKIDSYLKEKLNKDRTQYFDNNLEIL